MKLAEIVYVVTYSKYISEDEVENKVTVFASSEAAETYAEQLEGSPKVFFGIHIHCASVLE